MNEQSPAKSPENENQTAQLLRELHDLLRERNRPRPWYTREPFKSMLAHGTTVCIAIVLGAMIHHCTGETVVTIEAKRDDGVSMSRATAASAPPGTAATSNAVVITEDLETVTTSAPSAKPSPPRTVHTWIVTTPATAVAMAPSKSKAPPPAAAPVAIPAPQEPVRTASPLMLDSK